MEWVEIEGFENYLINKEGEIYFKGRNYVSSSGRLIHLKPRKVVVTKNTLGYCVFSVNDGVNKKKLFLHRELMKAFVPNPDNKEEVDHINGIPYDNRLENLRWATHKENLNNPVSVMREIISHTGKESNIKGRKKVWIDKDNKIYKMI